MVGTLFYLLDNAAHPGEYRRFLLIVNIALEQLKYVKTITRILHKSSEENVQPVVHLDEVVPVLGAASNCCFVSAESLAGEITSLKSFDDVGVSETRTVQGNADAGRKDGIDKTTGIPY